MNLSRLTDEIECILKWVLYISIYYLMDDILSGNDCNFSIKITQNIFQIPLNKNGLYSYEEHFFSCG